ncbi:MAG: hypothetical protein IPQ25_15690 [Chitinophagaceae bacterium]|nr:hypothetical protein [Chitinophagaceae bacterium]
MYITLGSPESSKLWEFITTNDFNKAMPPVNYVFSDGTNQHDDNRQGISI